MATLIRCIVVVEANGKPLHAEKKFKEPGVEVSAAGSTGPLLQVLGFKREIRLVAKDVQQVSDSKIAEGRLAFCAKNGLKIIMSHAQPAQLQFLLTRLRGGGKDSGGGLTGGLPGRKEVKQPSDTNSTRRVASPALATPSSRLDVYSSQGILTSRSKIAKMPLEREVVPNQADVPSSSSRLSITRFETEVLSQILAFSDVPSYVLARFAEACTSLSMFAIELRGEKFRIDSSRGNIDVDAVAARISKRPNMKALDIEGWTQLTAGASPKIARVLQGSHLTHLNLRNCKNLSDASIKRILEVCPLLQVLNLLEIPRLSNQALDVPLKCLRILAAGSLGRQPKNTVNEWKSSKFPTNLTIVGAQLAIDHAQLPEKKPLCSVNYTSTLLTRLTSGGSPLTYLVLPCCTEIEVLPRLPRSLLHLDLRGANLQLPAAAAPGWRPLSSCSQLQTLCLAHNKLLCAEALLACVASVANATLRVLDLSGTKTDGSILQHLLVSQKKLTHLRIAQCTALGSIGSMQLNSWFSGLPDLEVLDFADCYIDVDIRGASLTSSAPSLRLVGVGSTVENGVALDAIREAFATCAPNAYVVGGSLDVFNRYEELPPSLK